MTKSQKKELWDLLKQYVIQRDWYKCARCGSTKKGLHLCHIYPEGEYTRMIFIPENLFLACYKCHLSWWHKNILEAYRWYIKHFSISRRNKLDKIAKNYDKLDKPDYESIKNIYSKKIK